MEILKDSQKRSIITIVFIISTAMFLYQIVLTRLFSVMFSYHYVFLITSIAILGLGIGSVLSYRFQALEVTIKYLTKLTISLGVSFASIFIFVFYGPYLGSPVGYMIIMALPFAVGGYIFGLIFKNLSQMSDQLYLSDLFGSGLGAIIVILSINYLGIIKSIIIICTLPLIAFLFLNLRKKWNKSNMVVMLISFLSFATLLFLPTKITSDIETSFKGVYMSPSGTYSRAFENGLTPIISFSKWNAFSRTDVISIEEINDQMYLTIDGGANAPMYQFDGNSASLGKFKSSTGFLPFAFGDVDKSLLIGSGGGRDVLYALAGDSKDITALDINASTMEAVLEFSDYNGHIYDREEVTTIVDDGRGYIEKSEELFDVIFLSLVMTNSSQGVAYALAEDYIYTVEAFESYLEHLTEKGKVGFLVHDLDDMSKIIGMSVQALVNRGIPLEETPNYLSVFSKVSEMENGEVHYKEPVIIMKKTPYMAEETNRLVAYSKDSQSEPIYLPGYWEEGPLKSIKEETLTLDGYLNQFASNMTPATDNKPYFYNFEKGIPRSIMLVLSFAIIVALLIFGRFSLQKNHFKPTSYFALLGLAFMLIEIATIQKFTLFLGHPTLAIVFVLSSLLIGSGLGSYFGNKLLGTIDGRVYWPALMISVINIIVLIVFDQLLTTMLSMDKWQKVVIAVLIVLAQGFVMGMPFSRGMLVLSKKGQTSIIPMMIGVNGVMSVAGSALAIVISMTYGFSATIIFGSLLYGIVAFVNFSKEA